MADFDWDAFLDLADELARRRGDAGAARSAVSRAYYAAFHEAAGYVARRGWRLTLTGDDHRLVWEWFSRPDVDQSVRWIGNAGRRLRQARRRADYDPRPIPGLSTDAERWAALARQLVSVLRGR